MFRVVYTDPFFAPRGERPDTSAFELEREVFGSSVEVRSGHFADGAYVRQGPKLADAVQGADAIIVARTEITPELIAALKPNCRAAIRQGIGYDNLNPP